MVRTPPATWPEGGPAPSGSPKPGLLDGLAELARPKSFEEKLAEARKFSLIPDSLGGEAISQPQSAPSSWLTDAQLTAAPATAWPDAPTPKSVVRRDGADPTPEMHRGWLDAYFRYSPNASKGAADPLVAPTPMLPTQIGKLPGLAHTAADYFAPNLTSLLMGEPAPPIANLPDTPGKVPSTDDPRFAGAATEIGYYGQNFLPVGGPAAGVARAGLGMLRAGSRFGVPFYEAMGRGLGREVQASRARLGQQLYEHPELSPRPFEADYRKGARTDATGRLTHDPEGWKLEGTYVVGRNVLGGKDVALPVERLIALAEALTGSKPVFRSPKEMGNAAGWIRFERGESPVIELRNDLSPEDIHRVLAHEIGHAIDKLAGQIPARGLLPELRRIYNTGNNSKRALGGHDADPHAVPYTPLDRGYGGPSVYREYIAEAIRAYLLNPNYIKSIAPETAARIRQHVNATPYLQGKIQFNSVPGLGLTPLLWAEDDRANGDTTPN
jgi:hypothetical protein